MAEWFLAQSPVMQALLGTIFTWFQTALGAFAVIYRQPLLPYNLSFAAGVMIYVVAEELIPESQAEKHSDSATIGIMIGFSIMMTLDVARG